MGVVHEPNSPVLRPRFDCLDGLRAIAAIVVVMHHTAYATGETFRSSLGPYLARADIGVAIFFLISGFLLYRPVVATHLGDLPAPGARVYLERRAVRIFPAYWLALIGISVFIGFGPGQELDGVWSWICHLLLIQVYQPDEFFRGITQSWTLSVEISFYVFLPVYAWAIRRFAARRPPGDRLRVEIAGLVVLAAIGLGFNAVMQWGSSTYLTRVGKAWLPANLDLFAIGMAMALLSAWVAGRRATPTWVEWIGRIGGWWWVGAACTFWFVARHTGLTGEITPIPKTGFPQYAEHYLYGLTATFLLLPAVFGTTRRGFVRSVLRFAPVAWLGLVSYEIYLWHQGWLKKALQWTDSAAFQGPFWRILAIVLACTIPTAALSYYVVERTLVRWQHRRRASQEPSPVAR
ncbi:MAG: acyltransferase family protein [Acidimicrobiia bacterium]